MSDYPTNGRREIVKPLLLASIALVVLSFFLKDRLPPQEGILDGLQSEPVQEKGELPQPFEVTRKGATYTVTPLYNYDLYGMVVSYHNSDSFVDLAHKRWKDYLNVKDLCVIWGKNVESDVYRKMKFSSRDFTCYYTYPDEETFRLFSESCLSNNHLLSPDPALIRSIMSARRGDQIHLRGYLAMYDQKRTGFHRGTSISRDDRGNGACETVYVTDFTILKRANPGWRAVFNISLLSSVAGIILLFFL
jgi:hypothetical protein